MTANFANNENTSQTARRGVGRSLLWMVWSAVVSIANSLVLWIVVARLRSVGETSEFTSVMGLYALFFGICSLGLMPYLVSEVSRRDERSKSGSLPENNQTMAGFISSATVFLFLSGVICAVLMTVGGLVVSRSETVHSATFILSLAMIPTGLIVVAESVAIALGRTKLVAGVSTLENGLRTVIPVLLIWFGFSLTVVCASFVLVRMAALFAYLWAARHRLAQFAFDKAEFFSILKVSPTFGGIDILSSINWQAGVILLGILSTETETSRFGLASRFLLPVSILMGSYASVIQPVVTRHSQKSIENAGSYLSKMVGYPLILATLAAVSAPFLSGPVLTLFFGETYTDAAATLNILAISVIPFSVVMVAARGLVATNSQRIDFYANALGGLVVLAACALLIPSYGAVGAAVAQLLSFLVMALFEIGYLSRTVFSFRVWQKMGLAAACLLIIYAVWGRF